MDPYQELANAIVVRAADDYRDALKKLKYNPNHRIALDTTAECERFFRSQWYQALTTVDGEMLMRKLRQEVQNS